MVALGFITRLPAALAIGAPLAHVLEMPVRRTYAPALYVTVTHTLYRYVGIVVTMIAVGAVVAAVIWAARLAKSRTARISARAAGRWRAPRAWCWRTLSSGSSSTR